MSNALAWDVGHLMATRNCCGNWFIGGVCRCKRIATVCRFILFNIDALTSAASSARSDATANEGRVNYDASDVPIEARAAPTTGSGCHGWVLACTQRCEK